VDEAPAVHPEARTTSAAADSDDATRFIAKPFILSYSLAPELIGRSRQRLITFSGTRSPVETIDAPNPLSAP